MEITKRELLVSIPIICILIIIGLFIYNAIDNNNSEHMEKYYKAIKIENNADQFSYGMKTNIGNALIYDEFSALNGAEIPELINKYFAIRKSTEQYTIHTRVITYTDSQGHTQSKTETYYTWDAISSAETFTNRFAFAGHIFDIDKIYINHYDYLQLNKDIVSAEFVNKIYGNYIFKNRFGNFVGNIRFYYEIVPYKFNGTLFSRLAENTINDAELYRNKNIQETIKQKEQDGKSAKIIFVILFIIIICVLIYIFYKIDNDWLNN